MTRPALEALRYRAEDVGRTITRSAVREARARELQRELLNSERLAEYFLDHEAERVRYVCWSVTMHLPDQMHVPLTDASPRCVLLPFVTDGFVWAALTDACAD